MSRATPLLFVALVAAGSTACSDGIITPVDATPATLTKVAGDNQTATVQSPVGVPPAVLVENAHHQPIPGVAVTFAASSGSGSATGAKATTDARGIATVGTWTLGTSAGTHTLVATVSHLDSMTFTATGVHGPAARLASYHTAPLTAIVGSDVALPPAVRASDAYGNAVPGVTVTFVVAAGGGSATGLVAVTDSNGVAGVGAWTVGTVAGRNALTASVDGLPPLTLTALGIADSPASVTKQAGDGQLGSVSAPVEIAPSILVKDAYGNLVSDAGVTFAVVAGGGELTDDFRFTDRTGTATVGWLLGPSPGTNTVSASVAGLAPVVFTATAEDPCTEASSYTIGTSVSGELSVRDCRLPSGEYADLYALTVAGLASVRLDMSSSAFVPRPILLDASGGAVAAGPFYCYEESGNYCISPISVHALLPAGDYAVGASGFAYDISDLPYAVGAGAYELSSTPVPEDVTGCDVVFIARGVTTAQRIDTSDCAVASQQSSAYSDQFRIQLTAGQTYTISMSSAEFDTFLALWMEWGSEPVVANDDFSGSSNSQITFTPSQSGLYVIHAATHTGDTTGAYTLVVQ